ncbi:hypothetical protein [Dickeya parazeae]|nr:hypothetical protein [Dickeya parazeae]
MHRLTAVLTVASSRYVRTTYNLVVWGKESEGWQGGKALWV